LPYFLFFVCFRVEERMDSKFPSALPFFQHRSRNSLQVAVDLVPAHSSEEICSALQVINDG
jgi:hypothetical protein